MAEILTLWLWENVTSILILVFREEMETLIINFGAGAIA
jgi:hypothetical protein